MLACADDEHYQRRILTQLNVAKAAIALHVRFFMAQRGELRQRYREGQEDQLGALGLVVNAIVLWNTLYMAAALKELSRVGYEVCPEDVARLSPLIPDTSIFRDDTPLCYRRPWCKAQLRPLRDPRQEL